MRKPFVSSLPVWLLALLALCACTQADEKTQGSATVAEVAPATTWFPLKLGEREIRVQLAIAPKERQRGLMQRKELGENDGMLFLFEEPSQQSFWMHNTPLPLSIGFFSPDGVLQEIYWMYPFDRTTTETRSRDLQYALEMNQGWFKQAGVKTGAQLDKEALRAAIIARGFKPEDYGL